MIINGKTPIVVNGRTTRVCGHQFNKVTRGRLIGVQVCDTQGNILVPSKGLSWDQVAEQVRAGKSVQAKAV